MDLDNIYFSNLKKFDGKKLRRLNLSEIGQIAGRAGRYLNDGSFGITEDVEKINADEINLIENHKFEEIRTLYWRNSKLNFTNSSNLLKSLEEKPNYEWLRRINECEDEKVLKYFLKENNSKINNRNENQLKLLWECCQIPDFVKKNYGQHLEVVNKVFEFLNGKEGKITNQYMKKQLQQLDKLEGNVDSISNRIANVRTWSYVANKINWVENQDYWIERTKNLEDKLSDRLHEELTKSFIDKRASVLSKGLKQDITLKTEILENRKVLINKHLIGQLNGLKLELDLKVGALDTDIKSLKKAAKQNVEPEILNRIKQIKKSGLIELKDDFKIYWKDFPIAKLSPGKDYLNPEINLLIDDMLDNVDKSDFAKFIQGWINKKISLDLKSLTDLKNIITKNTTIRALAYQLYENNGVIKRENVKDFIKKLNQDERKILRNLGVKFGRYHIFLYKLLKPSAVSLRIALWKNFHQKFFNLKPPTFGLNFLNAKKEYSKDFMLICGFEKFDSFFVRIDILERLFVHIINQSTQNKKEIKLIPEMLNLLGCKKEDFLKLIKKMNYYSFTKNDETYFRYTPFKNYKKENLQKVYKKENPFSILKNINFK